MDGRGLCGHSTSVVFEQGKLHFRELEEVCSDWFGEHTSSGLKDHKYSGADCQYVKMLVESERVHFLGPFNSWDKY